MRAAVLRNIGLPPWEAPHNRRLEAVMKFYLSVQPETSKNPEDNRLVSLQRFFSPLLGLLPSTFKIDQNLSMHIRRKIGSR